MTEIIQMFSGLPGGAHSGARQPRGVWAGPGGTGRLAGLGGPIDDLIADFRTNYLPQILDQDVAPRVRQEASDAVKPWVLGALALAGIALAVALSAKHQAGAR